MTNVWLYNRIIASLLHFASTLTTQNEILKNQNEINYYIISKRVATRHVE